MEIKTTIPYRGPIEAIMKNLLEKQNLFATPVNVMALHNYIQRLPHEQRIIGYTIASMTWNLASQAIDGTIKSVNMERFDG